MTNYSLTGLCVLNTRPLDQNKSLSRVIESAGGRSIELPTIEIVATKKSWINELPTLARVSVVVFISANAVKFFFDALNEFQIKWPEHIKTVAIGKATANALARYKIRVDCIPQAANSESLINLSVMQELSDKTLIQVKGSAGRAVIADYLDKHGVNVHNIEVYARTMPTYDRDLVSRLWQEDFTDVILLTSVQSGQNLFTMFGDEGHSWLLNKPYIVISERIAAALRDFGANQVVVSYYDSLMKALDRFNIRIHS